MWVYLKIVIKHNDFWWLYYSCNLKLEPIFSIKRDGLEPIEFTCIEITQWSIGKTYSKIFNFKLKNKWIQSFDSLSFKNHSCFTLIIYRFIYSSHHLIPTVSLLRCSFSFACHYERVHEPDSSGWAERSRHSLSFIVLI